jgi:hypothetical protein
MRFAAALTAAGTVVAVLGGLVVWAASSGTRLERAVAYGFWFTAAFVLVLMVIAGRRFVWQRTRMPVPEGWTFLTAAGALTVIGIVIDVSAS